ncbi:MAG: hemerythrin [Candidatus Accumulibacter sp.]|nr:hemerythrin [Accumulibacter sp.]
MSYMPWSEALSVGLKSVDEQHRWLVDATNRLHAELVKATPDRAVMGRIIEGLMDYTMNHFIMEEELFERYAYPETAAHKAQHDHFTAQVMDTLVRFEDGEDVGQATLDFLKNWLIEHIMRTDKAYAPFLAAHGIV